MKIILAQLVAMLFLSALAVGETDYMLKMTGGRIMKPGSQQGEITLVNCQNAADTAWLEEVAEYLRGVTFFKVSVRNGNFDLTTPKLVGNASIFVVEDTKLPTLLCAPENAWCTVNVLKLKSEKRPFFEARVKKELSRAFAFLCAGTGSQFQSAITAPVTKVEDLDRFVNYKLPMDTVNKFRHYMQPFGAVPGLMTTYRLACNHGWAPEPTNDYQRAIWEEVKNRKADASDPTNRWKRDFPEKK